MIPEYIGNGAYCYANSVSMLLKHASYKYPPKLIEILSGLGLGIFMDTRAPIIFFSNHATSPEDGINNALNLLGFTYTEKDFKDAKTAFKELQKAVKKGPVVIGPIDVNYMKHWGKTTDEGGDHYILVYKIEKNLIWVHDPQEFPATPLPIKDFLNIWEAKNITFKKKKFHFWTKPKQKDKPSKKELFKKAMNLFKSNYEKSQNHPNEIKIDKNALIELSKKFNKRMPPFLLDHLTKFAFPVIVRRSLDYANFFRENNANKLAKIKEEQAELFSACQVHSMKKEWKKVSSTLEKLAELEKKFKKELIK
jgi:hypothetical protein